MAYTKEKAIDSFTRAVDGLSYEFNVYLRRQSRGERDVHFDVECKDHGKVVKVRGTDLRAVEDEAVQRLLDQAHGDWKLLILVKAGGGFKQHVDGVAYDRSGRHSVAFLAYTFIAVLRRATDGKIFHREVSDPFPGDKPWDGTWAPDRDFRTGWLREGLPETDAVPSERVFAYLGGTDEDKARAACGEDVPGVTKVNSSSTRLNRGRESTTLLIATPEVVEALQAYAARLAGLGDQMRERFSDKNLAQTLRAPANALLQDGGG